MTRTEVVLLAPNTLGFYKFSGKSRENLALGALGASLNQHGFNTEIIDARLDHLTQDDMVNEICRLAPILIGISMMGSEAAVWSVPLVQALSKVLPESQIVAGSYYPTLNTEQTFNMMPELDAIVLGEGENTLSELAWGSKQKDNYSSISGIAQLNNNQVTYHPWRQTIKNLDSLPDPIRYADGSLISKVSLEGSRGCMARCTFCSIGPHTDPRRSSWRGKSPERIVEELVQLRQRYPSVSQYRFVDADFLGMSTPQHIQRLQTLAEGLVAAGFNASNAHFFIETQAHNALAVPPGLWNILKKVGLYQVFIGVENSSEKVKKAIHKVSDFETDLLAIGYLKSFGFNVTYGLL